MKKINPLLQKTIVTSGTNFLFRIFGLATSFFAVFTISRLFGVSNFGNYSLIFTISQAIAMIFALGIPNALIMLIGNKNLALIEAKALLFKGIKIVFLFSLFPFALFYFGSEYVSQLFGKSDLNLFFKTAAFAIPFFILQELILYYFISVKKFLVYNLFMFVLPNLFLGIFLLLFYYYGKTDFYTFLAFALAIFLVVLIELILVYESKIPSISPVISTKLLLKTASPMMFSGLLLYLLNWTDIIMLGMMVDETQVGIYTIAYKIGSVGFLVIVSVSTIITPQMASLYGSGHLLELKKLIHQSTRLIAVLSVPLVLFLVFFSEYILSFFGSDVVSGSSTLIIVSIGVLFSAGVGNVDQILNMTSNQIVLRNITFLVFIINVILNLLLIPVYGINGAAIASLVSNIVINLFCVYYIKKKLGFYTLF